MVLRCIRVNKCLNAYIEMATFIYFSTDDINEMVNWMKQLSKKIDSIQTEFVTTESLSASPKPRPQF